MVLALALSCAWCSAGAAQPEPAPSPPPPAAPAPGPQAEHEAGPAAPVREPPRLESFEPLWLEPGVADPELQSIEVTVLVERDGRARLDDPAPSGALRAALERALTTARFRPALVGGEPVEARVRLRVRLSQAPRSEETPGQAAAPAAAEIAPPPSTPTAPAPQYELGARAQVEQLPPTGRRLELEATQDMPGAFGDPFRVVDSLPGVVPVFSGLPYVYVRGAPPAGTVYYYDGIQVPALFHLALGPAVVHPAMIGDVDFYASVAPARYGRYTGGVLAGGPNNRTPPARAEGELELRLIDAMGMVKAPVLDGTLMLAGRYGYPGLLLTLLSPEAVLAYWDYQAQFSVPLGRRDELQLVWFGSFDRAGARDEPDEEPQFLTLEFHRLELRLIRRVGRLELGSMLQVGFDRSELDREFQVTAARLGPRIYLQWHGDEQLRLRVGADMIGTTGKLDDPIADDSDVDLSFDNPLYASVAARNVFGAYAELHVEPWARIELDLGARLDTWLTGTRAEAAVDPRAAVTYHASETIRLHAAAGLGHQPAVFLLPLPGIADVALDQGLQRAVQSEIGVAFDLPANFLLETQLYLQRHSNMLFPDLYIERTERCAELPDDLQHVIPECERTFPRASAWAYGVELFVRRPPSEALSGWLSYTLGRAQADPAEGDGFTPSFDVRHVGNLVLQYRIGWGFAAGTRLHYRSGKVASFAFERAALIRHEQRLPGFFRADAQLSYGWTASWARFKLTLEWLNLTMAREATGIECDDTVGVGRDPILESRGSSSSGSSFPRAARCRVDYAPAIFLPNLGLRAEL